MGISTDTMAKILSNSRKLMTGEAQDKINTAARSGKVYENFDFDSNNSASDTLTYQYTEPLNNNSSKLPKAILESMVNNQIDCSSLDPDGMSNLMKKIETQMPQSKQVIKEEKLISPSNGVIDYSLIKEIVEECIDRKLKEVNESTLKGVKLKEGKISLIDNSGNVFQATLEYKGKSKK